MDLGSQASRDQIINRDNVVRIGQLIGGIRVDEPFTP